jgi:thiol-disulfide isomerase/thioredoxin
MKKLYIYILIVIVLIIAAGIYVDKSVKINVGPVPTIVNQSVKNLIPNQNAILQDYGKAPDFKAGDTWLNSQPLTIADLKGKVFLIDFWTYSCINCIRTLPYVTKWYDTYKDKGLVVVGVHTPEFSFEHDTNNVKNAISQFNIHYPVVQDNDYSIWNSYGNEYWPAEYLINQKGEIVEEHFGEGNYAETENAIVGLLGMSAPVNQTVTNDNLDKIGSPEMYFGTDRLQNLTLFQSPSATPKNYNVDQNLQLNTFSLGGTWEFSPGNIQLAGNSGKIKLNFNSGKVYIVASSQNPATLKITVDGKPQPSVTVQESKLYTLFDSQDYTTHTIEININQPGFDAFTFTFG